MNTSFPFTALPPADGGAIPGQQDPDVLRAIRLRQQQAQMLTAPTGPAPGAAPPVGAPAAPAVAPTSATPPPAQFMQYPEGLVGATSMKAKGLTSADRRRQGELIQEGAAGAGVDAEAVQQQQDLAAQHAAQTQALTQQTNLAQQTFEKSAAEEQRRRAELVTRDEDARKRIESKMGELEAQGVDPNHYWESQSTAGKIAGAIAIGLGQFGTMLSGRGDNAALKIINSAITNDIDAQRMNLQHRLSLLKDRVDLNETGFNHQSALLNAEKESIQTGYQIAMGGITKKAAMFGDNAGVQQRAATMVQGLQKDMADRLAQKNEQIYAIDKGAEKLVAANPNQVTRKEFDEYAGHLRMIAASGGHDMTEAEAQRQATQHFFHVDTQPGAENVELAKPQKAAAGANKPLSPRLVTKVADLDAAEAAAHVVLRSISGNDQASRLPFVDKDRAGESAAAAEQLRRLGYESIPKDPTTTFEGRARAAAATLEAIKDIKRKKANILAGGGGADEPEAEPSQFGAVRDE